MSFIRFERETRDHAIERFCESRIKKRKPLVVSGYTIQAGYTGKFAIERIGRKGTLIILGGMMGQINIPLLSKKETAILELE